MKQYSALALIELTGISKGLVTCDAMIKKAPITMLKTGTVSRGKYLILIGGSVASVEEAFEEGLRTSGTDLVDSVFLPAVHEQVHDRILGLRATCTGDALGALECVSVATMIQAADAAIKGADVDLVEMRLADNLGGRSFALFSGSLEDVEAAISIGREIIKDQNMLLRDSIIPRLDPGLAEKIKQSTRFSESESTIFDDGEV